jgi:voltage-gated sodium channel
MAEVAPDSAEAVSTVNIEETDKPKETGGLSAAAAMKDEAPASPASPGTKKKLSEILAKKSAAAALGFTDPQDIKDMVKERLETTEAYSVYNFYKDKEVSYASRIAQHNIFENTTLAIISLNAVYIAIDTDWNKASSPEKVDWYFQAMEHFFCVYFTWEWIIRFVAFKRKQDCIKDAWFDFDSCLVFLMVMETWVVPLYLAIFTSGDGKSPLAGGNTAILRLFRLLRLTRLMRMLRSLPQLMILIKGMIQAMRSVAYVMCLLIIITYVYSIAFTQLTVATPLGETYFSGVWMGMYSLIIYATFLDDLSVFMDDIVAESTHLRIILLPLALTFIGLSALTLMNMLVGVLCEVVANVAEKEKQEILTEMVIQKMQKVAESLDEDGNLCISYEEFSLIVSNKEALNALEEVGVNPVGVVEFAELFFFDDQEAIELAFRDFMDMILDLREENTAKVKDTLEIWRHIKTSTNKELVELKKDMKRVDDAVESASSRIQNQISEVSSLVKQIASKQR